MSSAALCALMLTVAVDYGYEPIERSDGVRYVILLEPAVLDALGNGTPVGSMIPPEVRGRVHEFRIVTNGDRLSKQVPPRTEQPTPPDIPTPPVTPPPTDVPAFPEPGWPTEPQSEPVSPKPPGLLPDSGNVKPASGFEDIAPDDGPSGNVDTTDPEVPESSESDPWLLLAIASVVAMGSSGGMVFFGWLTFDYRSRYLALLRESLDTGSSWLDEPAGEQTHAEDSGESSEYSVSQEAITEEVAAPLQSQDSAWQELGSEKADNLDDWLNEEPHKDRRSRRNRKRSR
jgi:hypothetical protein